MSNSDKLIDRLLPLDPEAKEILTAENIAWVRTRLGVVGEIRVPIDIQPEIAPRYITQEIERAHALLDQLPLQLFRRSDMWNLLLFVSVPYESNVSQDLAQRLEASSRDLVGSRKVLLWRDDRVQDYLQPLAKRSADVLGVDDPLREALLNEARDYLDRRAVDILFKRRLDDNDIDALVNALGRGDPL